MVKIFFFLKVTTNLWEKQDFLYFFICLGYGCIAAYSSERNPNIILLVITLVVYVVAFFLNLNM